MPIGPQVSSTLLFETGFVVGLRLTHQTKLDDPRAPEILRPWLPAWGGPSAHQHGAHGEPEGTPTHAAFYTGPGHRTQVFVFPQQAFYK